MHREPRILQGLSFIATPSTAALSHTRPASAEIIRIIRGAKDSDKRWQYILTLKIATDGWQTAKSYSERSQHVSSNKYYDQGP